MKPLLPSLREKKRYIAFEIYSEDPVQDFKQVAQTITDTVIQTLGELDTAKAGLLILHDSWSPEEQKGLLRVNHTHVEKITYALSMIDNIHHTPTIITTIAVSGIMKKALNTYQAS